MNIRKDIQIKQVSDDIVLAQKENYCVAVVKMKGTRLNKTGYCIIITKEESLMNQSKESNELTVFVKKLAITVKNKAINRAYKAIYDLIN
ncbi:hypothetical protein V7200_18365 [Cytobacillus firmus]|uniref:Uncharacterized protein n=1 Tax=Cytobacillus firmus TaxID=1399 RepID=A0A800MTF6_CYTFI|nr:MULTISPECIES: hypothetical protein [Bacillaceae]KAF0822183.1 hypothetical protein KIS1582_4049 [Cytobacillus firmus]